MIFRFVLNSEEYGAFVLPNEPVGWKDIELILKRSLEYHGIFYEAMASLEFKCGSGKEYIDTAYDELGPDAVINITIYVSCVTGSGSVESPDYSIDYSDDYGSMATGSGAPVFETLFEGVLEFKNYSKTSESTTVSLIQTDFLQNIMNRFDTKVNIDENVDLDGNALLDISNIPYSLNIPSKAIRYGSSLRLDEALQADPFVFPNISDNYQFFYINHPFVPVYNDLEGFATVFPVVQNRDSLTGEPDAIMIAPYTGTYQISYNLAGTIKFNNNDASSFNVFYKIKYGINSTGQAATQIGSTFGGLVPIGGNRTDAFSVSGTLTLGLTAGDRFQFWTRVNGSSSVENTGVGVFDCSFELDYSVCDFVIYTDTTTASSTSSSYYIHELGASIAQRITGINDAFRSTLLGRKNSLPNLYASNGCLSFMAMSNGKKIRGFPSENSLFISMNEFYKTINSIGNIGIGFESNGDSYVLRMEEKSYFYDTATLLQFTFVSNIKTSIAKDYYVSDISIGYESWESEETNGIDEFNTTREYNTGIKSINSKLVSLSPTIASSYAIEFTRRKQYVDFPSLDWKYDNNNFIFCLNRSVDGSGNPNNLNTVELDENYTTINNVFSPESTYNYRISPARNLLRHLSVIGSSLIKYADRTLKFVYGEGNYVAETEFTSDSCNGNYNNDLLSESENIPWLGSGNDPIWIPEYIEFEYPLTFSQYLTLKETPTGCIEVSETDSNFVKGFIIDIQYKPVGGLASFKLLKAYVN